MLLFSFNRVFGTPYGSQQSHPREKHVLNYLFDLNVLFCFLSRFSAFNALFLWCSLPRQRTKWTTRPWTDSRITDSTSRTFLRRTTQRSQNLSTPSDSIRYERDYKLIVNILFLNFYDWYVFDIFIICIARPWRLTDYIKSRTMVVSASTFDRYRIPAIRQCLRKHESQNDLFLFHLIFCFRPKKQKNYHVHT